MLQILKLEILSISRSITKSYYRNSVGALLVYDICNRLSFDHIPRWMMEARRHIDPHEPVFVLVGCKLDLAQKGEREISSEEAKAFADQHGMFTIETSAKTGLHVEEAFVAITEEVNMPLDRFPARTIPQME